MKNRNAQRNSAIAGNSAFEVLKDDAIRAVSGGNSKPITKEYLAGKIKASLAKLPK